MKFVLSKPGKSSGWPEVEVRSYATLIAHTSIVYPRYMILAYYYRQHTDNKTIPGLFYAFSEKLKTMSVKLCLQIICLEHVELLLLSRGHVGHCDKVVELVSQFHDRHPMLSGYSVQLQCLTAKSDLDPFKNLLGLLKPDRFVQNSLI